MPLERGSFCLFYKKNIWGLGYLPFQEKIKGKWSEKLKMTFLNHFHQGVHPGARPERVRCISHRRSPWPHLSRTWSRSRWLSHWVQRALNRGDSGGRSSETGAADRVGSLRTLPNEVVVPTGHSWAHMTWKCPQSPQKNGGGGYARIPKAWPSRFDFGEEGRPSHDFSYFSMPFLPWVFQRRLFKVLRKKNEIHWKRNAKNGAKNKNKKSSSHRATRTRCERCQIPVPTSWALRGRNFRAWMVTR